MPPTEQNNTLRTVHVKRRNGKLQSCEPCRLRKLSCDHRLPACTRCIRRKQEGQCYYHPAPMTRKLSHVLASPPQSATTSTSLTPEHDSLTHAAPSSRLEAGLSARIRTPLDRRLAGQPRPTLRADTVPPPDRIQEILSVPSAGILMDTSAKPRPVGYLGEISSSAFVAELNDNLGIDTPATLNESHTEHLSDDYIEKGIKVLSYFQSVVSIERFIHKWLQKDDSYLLYSPVIRIWFEEMTPVIQNASTARELASLAAQVWCNTQQTLPCKGDLDARQWARAATGSNLRWESIGLVLTQAGIIACLSPAWDPIFEGGQPRREMIDTSRELAGICIDLSRRCASRNELLVCLLYDRMLLWSIMYGDISSKVWMCFSEVADTAILLGLHLEPPENAEIPFFLRELRSRIFNVVYSMDKLLSTFLGRPPRISYRYAVVAEPHDLTDLEVCSDSETLQKRLMELDLTGGWSTHGVVNRATWRKAWTKRHVIREEVLEIVIGPHTTDIRARLDYIRAREESAFRSMPEFCRLDPEQLVIDLKRNPTLHIPGRGVSWRPVDVQCVLALHTSIRHATFLLERAAVNKTRSDATRLIAAARSLLSLVLKAYTLSDFLIEFHVDLTDSLAFYVVPAAGVLALELLKREQYYDATDTFPRSEVLQQLSVLVPMLEAVPPDEGNGPVCAIGLHAIKKVLDRLLSRPYQRPMAQDTVPDGLGNNAFITDMSNDADFLQWLGNLDFNASDWQIV